MSPVLVEQLSGRIIKKAVTRSARRGILDFSRLVSNVADRFGMQAATLWTNATLRFQGQISEKNLRSALASGRINSIEAAVGPVKLQQALSKVLVDPLTRAAQSTGLASASALAAKGIEASFNAAHPNVILYARQHAAEMVAGIPKETKQIIAEVVARGAERGLTVLEQARAIREVVGLTPAWADAVINFEVELQSGEIAAATGRRISGALAQKIRSKAADGTLTDAFIQEASAEYSASLINARALMIARTETIDAANFGLQESWDQAQADGVLPDNTRQFWLASPNACDICLSIPDMNPDGVALDEPFLSIDGEMDQPPDPHPNCGCGLGLGFVEV